VEQVNVTDPDWLTQLYLTVVNQNVDVVVLALTGQGEQSQIADICNGLADQPVRICLAIDTIAVGRPPGGLERFGRAILVDLVGDPHAGLGGVAKRAIDIVFSAAAIAVLAPAFLLITVLVRWESPGPAIFRQKRFGLGGRAIEVLKFRSMYLTSCDVTGERRTLARDPRVTQVGRVLRRLSLDELPQLFNVLRGDMSLVGPRPHPLQMRVGESYYFDVVLQYRTRHIVKPGITGWAQVNGSRGEVNNITKARHRVELDLWYLENWSLLLDFLIILRTVWGGFMTRGAD
jgi:exopolysaccharide biosynthesis polyprenyl glycosylphosphotransferase